MGDRVLADSNALEVCSAGAVDVAHSPGGTRLATASASSSSVRRGDDGVVVSISVAVYDGGSGSPLWTLTGGFSLPHGARPTKLAWAHPEFGQALAVAADDGTVSIWVEEGGPRVVDRTARAAATRNQAKRHLRRWQRAAAFEAAGRGAASCLSFAPAVHGPRLAVGWGDGLVRVYVSRSPLLGCAAAPPDGDAGASPSPLPPAAEWELESEFEPSTPALPVTCLCWRPHFSGASGEKLPPMLAVGTASRRRQDHGGGGGGAGGGGGSAMSSVWLYRAPLHRWTKACTLDDCESTPNESSVSAVAWAPSGSSRAPERVATAAGASVRIFALTGRADAPETAGPAGALRPPPTDVPGAPAPPPPPGARVTPEAVLRHSSGVWRLEWASLGGGWLAAGTDAGAVVLWRQNLRGEWGAQSAIVAEESGSGGGSGEGGRLASSTVQQDASGLATVVV